MRRGYTGGYTVLRQRIKQLRKQCRRPPVERFETGPGVQAQMDWATYTIDFTQEGRRKVQALQLRAGILTTTVYSLHRLAGLGDDASASTCGPSSILGAAPRPAFTTT